MHGSWTAIVDSLEILAPVLTTSLTGIAHPSLLRWHCTVLLTLLTQFVV